MKDLNKASLGVYSNYWEYRRGIHRRLFSSDSFDEKEVLCIGRRLEGINKIGYHKIELRGENFHIYIKEDGVVTYLKG